MSAIELTGVGKRYPNGFVALHPTRLSVAEGQFVAVIGASGAGKSTLMRTLNGLGPATEGTVTIGGVRLDRRTERAIRARTGMIFQQFNLVGRLNVMTNVLTGRLSHRRGLASLLHLFPRSDFDLAHAALARVGLTQKAWERADRLSGGQQQRVGIARALAQAPSLILADEPVASLDPVSAVEILELLRTINRRDGITMLVSLHQVDYVRRFADRVIGMRDGALVFDGRPDELDDATLARIYGERVMERAHAVA
ncbi:MAG: phosphonate ABC transporter ATP-binding protein [Burkholderiales bacterium]